MQFLLIIYRCTAGVMAARGILNNPAMFAGYQSTPLQCVADWVSHRDHWSGSGFLGNLGHCRIAKANFIANFQKRFGSILYRKSEPFCSLILI